MAFRLYKRTEIITLRTRAYTDKDKNYHPEADLDLLVGKELPDGRREAHAVMASNDEWCAVWVSSAEVKE